jgi:hypothetical protein
VTPVLFNEKVVFHNLSFQKRGYCQNFSLAAKKHKIRKRVLNLYLRFLRLFAATLFQVPGFTLLVSSEARFHARLSIFMKLLTKQFSALMFPSLSDGISEQF